MEVRIPFRLLLPILLLPVAVAGCDDDDADPVVPDDPTFALALQESSAATALATAERGITVPTGANGPTGAVAPTGIAAPNRAVIGLELVESITLPVGEVQAQQAGGGWVDVGSLGAVINLLNLPAEGVVVLESTLPEGSYTGLRLFLEDQPAITLSGDVTVGRTTFEEGTHPLVIPSSEQSGVKLNAAFEVDDDGQTLTILHDSEGSVSRVTATGNGVLKIAPVLTVRNDDGEVVGELDEPDVEVEVEFEGRLDTLVDDVLTLDDGTVVVVGADTELDGDILTLEDVAAVLVAGETIHVDGEGIFDTDGTTILATAVRFDVE